MVGASGGLGQALAAALEQTGAIVRRLSRPDCDILNEPSVAAAAASSCDNLDLVVDATGFLHGAGIMPERSFKEIDPAAMAFSFAVNATGPALLMKHFLPRLARDRRAVFATLSAKVGSIGDNRLGGWMSYRASKAALNQLVRCAAIDLARRRPLALCVAIHPGTVATPLSDPFPKTGLTVQTPEAAAARLVATLATLTTAQSGCLIDPDGVVLPF